MEAGRCFARCYRCIRSTRTPLQGVFRRKCFIGQIMWEISPVIRALIYLLISSLTSFAGVEIEVSGVANQRGDICVMVFATKAGFPDDPAKALKKFAVSAKTAKAGVVRFKVPDLKKGIFAFVALHDEDGDRKLKKNFFGIPKEGVAVSNYPKLKPPTFAKAVMKNPSGVIRMKLSY